MGDWKSEAEALVWKIGSQTNRFCCVFCRGGGVGRGYHFAEEGGKFVLQVLAEMLLFALAFRRKCHTELLRHGGPFSGQGPGLPLPGGTRWIHTKKKKETPTQARTLIHERTCLFFSSIQEHIQARAPAMMRARQRVSHHAGAIFKTSLDGAKCVR